MICFYNQIDHLVGADPANITQYFVLADDGEWENGAHWQGTPQWENMGSELIGTVGGFNTITNENWSDFLSPHLPWLMHYQT